MKTGTVKFNTRILYLLSGFLLFLSFSPFISSVFLGATVLIWLLDRKYRDSFRAWSVYKTWWLFSGFYLMHVASLLWSQNLGYAFFDLQVKAAYLVCPVVFSGFSFSEKEWEKLRRAFIAGTTASAVYCFIRAAWNFLQTHEKESLFYEGFSALMHPTYFMMYLNLSILFLMYELFWRRKAGNGWRQFYFLALFVQLTALFMLSARTALATSLLTFVLYFFILFRNHRMKRSDGRIVVLFFSLAVMMQVILFYFYNRYDQITQLVEHPAQQEENSTSIRFHLWSTAMEVIGEQPLLGVGAGDIKEELVKKYTANHYEYGIKNRISPHNQYLHTSVILGITGLLFLLLMLFTGLRTAWKRKDFVYLLFILVILLNGLTESILERQAGVLFFAFFNSLFATQRAPLPDQTETA